MINNVDELIDEAKSKKTTEEKVKFILNYFVENVDYNYASILGAGYSLGTAKYFSGIKLVDNEFSKELGCEKSFTRRPVDGKTEIIDKSLELSKENSENFPKFLNEMKDYLTSILGKKLNNKELVDKNVNDLVTLIKSFMEEKFTVCKGDNQIAVTRDISEVFFEFITKKEKLFPSVIDKNGLLKKGVCLDYTKYLVSIMQKVGIEAHDAVGKDELGHELVIFKDEEKDEYKSADLTRAVFIRDGVNGIPKDQTIDDWIYTDLDKMFEMRENLVLSKIDGKTLPEKITINNFDNDKFRKRIQGQLDDKNFAQLVNEGLQQGITTSQVDTVKNKDLDSHDKNEKGDKVDE